MLLSELFGKKPSIDGETGLEEVDLIVRWAGELLGPELQALAGNRQFEGYLMGTLDALAQRMLIPDNESILVISAAYAALFPAQPGAFGRMLLLSHDDDFVRGQTVGRPAAMALLSGACSVQTPCASSTCRGGSANLALALGPKKLLGTHFG